MVKRIEVKDLPDGFYQAKLLGVMNETPRGALGRGKNHRHEAVMVELCELRESYRRKKDYQSADKIKAYIEEEYWHTVKDHEDGWEILPTSDWWDKLHQKLFENGIPYNVALGLSEITLFGEGRYLKVYHKHKFVWGGV